MTALDVGGDACNSGNDAPLAAFDRRADEDALSDGILKYFLLEKAGTEFSTQPQLVLQRWRIEDLVGAALKHDRGAVRPGGQEVLEFAAAEHAGQSGPREGDQRRKGRGQPRLSDADRSQRHHPLA